MKKVALVIGHLKSSGGATTYKGESEYRFYKRIAPKIAAHLDGKVEVKIFDRDPSSKGKRNQKIKQELKDWGNVFLSLELHFNAVRYKAYGCEMLVLEKHKSRGTHKLAQKGMKRLSKKFGLTIRNNNTGIKWIDNGDRGRANLSVPARYAEHICLIEPAFLNIRTHESEAIVEHEDDYAKTVADIILADFCNIPLDIEPGEDITEAQEWIKTLQEEVAYYREALKLIVAQGEEALEKEVKKSHTEVV